MTTGKTTALIRWTFLGKVMSLLFNMLSIFHSFSSKEKVFVNFMAAVIICSDFGAPENKICHCFHFPPSICHKVMGPDTTIFVFWMLSFKLAFYSPLSLSSRGSLVPLHFLPLMWYHLHIWGYWYFSQQSWFQLWFFQPSVSRDVLCM